MMLLWCVVGGYTATTSRARLNEFQLRAKAKWLVELLSSSARESLQLASLRVGEREREPVVVADDGDGDLHQH
uniref:Putative secreted protein n=1 Tax=Anopheles marajoara TaxID=58244 RepID=A0A2M4CDS5_9DIPT